MLNFYILCYVFLLYFPLTAMAHATMTDTESLQSPPQPFESQFDFQHITSCLDQIQVPAYVSTVYTNNHGSKRPTATDHSIVSAINASFQLCKKLGGEKGAATCSYMLIDRPWRQWGQKVSQYYHGIKTRYVPMTYNLLVKTLSHPYVDVVHALQNKVLDWWHFPSLEWHRLKSTLLTLWDYYYYVYLNWYYSAANNENAYYYNEMNTYPYRSGNKNNWQFLDLYYYSQYHHSNNEFEPDQDGCYHDVLGTTLCVDKQRLLDDNGLNDRVSKLFEAMTSEERSYTLRFQQRFIQWATKASLMTAEAMDRTQSLWLQHTQTAYRFLDDALNLDPHTNMTKQHQHDFDQEPARTTNQMNPCSPVVFPFSVSPFDTSLKTAFFSLGSLSRSTLPLSLSSSPSSLPPDLPLMPIRQPGTACSPNQQEDNTGFGSSTANTHGKPHRYRHQQYQKQQQQLLDPYNKIQHQYLLARLESKMLKELERLEKATLQEYYRVMDSTPHQWTLRHYTTYEQRQHLEKPHAYQVGFAAQHLYQELRLYISISLQQRYRRAIQQLMDVTKQYDQLVMKEVQHAYDEWEWTKKQQARRLFTFYPLLLHDDSAAAAAAAAAAAVNIHHLNEGRPEKSSSPSTSSINTRAVMFIGQRADWAIQAHRRTILHQWKTIFEGLDRQSRSIWVSAMDQAQGRHRIWSTCNATFYMIIAFIVVVKLVVFLLFLLYF